MSHEINYTDKFISATMATIPSRKTHLSRVIQSILPQVNCLNIYLNYPSGEPLPDCLLIKSNKLNLVRSIEETAAGDLSCNGKFYFLDKIKDGYIFTVDDDMVYPSDYVKNICKKIEQYNRQCVVGMHGGILPKRVKCFHEQRNLVHCSYPLKHDVYLNLLGTGVLGFHKSTLPKLCLHDFPKIKCADLQFAQFCQHKQVPFVCIEREDGLFKEFVYPYSLWNDREKLEKEQTALAQKTNWKVFGYNQHPDKQDIIKLEKKEVTNIIAFCQKSRSKYLRSEKYQKTKQNRVKISDTDADTDKNNENNVDNNTTVKNKMVSKKIPNKQKKTRDKPKEVAIQNLEIQKNETNGNLIMENQIQEPHGGNDVLIYLNTKYHFETAASFIQVALSRGKNVDLYNGSNRIFEPIRRTYLKDLFRSSSHPRFKIVNSVNYRKYNSIVYITYYPDQFPIIRRLKNVVKNLKEANTLETTRVYLACHEYHANFFEDEYLKRHSQTFTLCYLSPLGYGLSRKRFRSTFILPVFYSQEFKKVRSREDYDTRKKSILIQGNIESKRRNYRGLVKIAKELANENFYFKILGRGDMSKIKHMFKGAPEDKFQFRLNLPDDKYYQECAKSDFIMPLIDQSYRHDYFKSKLTSSISVCYGFNLPPIIHNELANIYKLPGEFVYSNHKTKNQALAVKKALDTNYDDYVDLKFRLANKYKMILLKNIERLPL